MKRFALVGLSILCLSLAATTSATARTRTERLAMSTATSTATTLDDTANPKTTPLASSDSETTRTERLAMSAAKLNDLASPKLTPFELVSRAYQGAYRMQGIAGFGSFVTSSADNTIEAKDIIKAAIVAKQLAPEAQIDRHYISAVKLQLLGNQH
ncbi:hypothetical protein [Chamaesiphon polymorphus]|uniref:Uncharacterized protein n=1 Tax=Chamaesiphon polymorphus CCALA 037 TaxID=2107692 RepID=A0A2T1G4S7_9CYAN|nr:hypothetical protein [Chamaesiphon polymorphus]PSB52166.1 hypothetical protein C7B77_20780 [Chamaesiphon polymorphus CCALA 037]